MSQRVQVCHGVDRAVINSTFIIIDQTRPNNAREQSRALVNRRAIAQKKPRSRAGLSVSPVTRFLRTTGCLLFVHDSGPLRQATLSHRPMSHPGIVMYGAMGVTLFASSESPWLHISNSAEDT